MIKRLHETKQEGLHDVYTGDMSHAKYDKLQEKMLNKLAHLHLLSWTTFIYIIYEKYYLPRKIIYFWKIFFHIEVHRPLSQKFSYNIYKEKMGLDFKTYYLILIYYDY